MYRNLFAAAGMAALFASGIAAAKTAPTPATSFSLQGSSSAAALNFTLTGAGSPIKLLNQVYASGTAAPNKYSKTTSVPSYAINKTYGDGAASITIKGSAKTVTSSASSAGVSKTGALTVSSNSLISSFTATLTNPILGTALSATGNNITSSAKNSGTKLGKTTPTGSVKIGKITLNSPLFGIKNATYTGTPAPNTKLYQSSDKSVTVYANYQKKTTTSAGETLLVDAVALIVKNYKTSGFTFSGELTLGTSSTTIQLTPLVTATTIQASPVTQ
jgi:hypothetical protein